MEKEIKYISDKKFREMTKKQKFNLPCSIPNLSEPIEIEQIILVPTNEKSDGYKLGAFFARNNKGWFRAMTYDCWQINTDIENPAKFKFRILKGDFEYGGVNIFGLVSKYHKAFLDYGGQIIIKNK